MKACQSGQMGVNMRLYKMELYKLCHRKIFIVGVICVVGILLFFFRMKVSEESATVEGITYSGYEAVRVNRQITEEFRGILTDEKVDKIVEKYGFPQEIEERSFIFIDTNFLNWFITFYLSDGYANGRDDYKIATRTYPIADTDLGAVRELTGKEVVLEYSNGLNTFVDVWDLGMILGSIVILFTISIVFSNESQTKMLQLLFTTQEGRKKDIFAKIAAAFTIAVSVWLGILLLDLALCGIVYGWGGLDSFAGMTTIERYISAASWKTTLTVGSSIAITLLRSLTGILLLCSITLWISASTGSTFHAVVAMLTTLRT